MAVTHHAVRGRARSQADLHRAVRGRAGRVRGAVGTDAVGADAVDRAGQHAARAVGAGGCGAARSAGAAARARGAAAGVPAMAPPVAPAVPVPPVPAVLPPVGPRCRAARAGGAAARRAGGAAARAGGAAARRARACAARAAAVPAVPPPSCRRCRHPFPRCRRVPPRPAVPPVEPPRCRPGPRCRRRAATSGAAVGPRAATTVHRWGVIAAAAPEGEGRDRHRGEGSRVERCAGGTRHGAPGTRLDESRLSSSAHRSKN